MTPPRLPCSITSIPFDANGGAMAGIQSLRLVIAEPNKAARDFLRKIITSAGLSHVHMVSDVRDAWETLQTSPPHVFLVDWSIASAADFILLRKMRSAGLRVPVVITAHNPTDDDKHRAAKAGAHGILNKPFSPRELVGAVITALRAAKAAPKNAKAPTRKPPPKAPTTAPEHDSPQDAAKRLFASGWKDLQLRKFDSAHKKLTTALSRLPDFPEAHKGLAEVCRGKGNLDGAMEHLLKASEIYAYTGDAQQAESLYTEVKKARPDAENPFKAAASRHHDEGAHDKAVTAFEHAHALSPKDTDIAVGLSKAYMNAGQDERAEETLRTILESVGEIPAAKDLFLKLTGEEWYYGSTSDTEGHEVQILDGNVQEKTGSEMRRHRRLAFADRAVKLPGVAENLPVVDISLGGLGFKPMSVTFKEGQKLTFDLVIMGTVTIKKIAATVRRVSPKIIGCQFTALTKRQAKHIHQMLGED